MSPELVDKGSIIDKEAHLLELSGFTVDVEIGSKLRQDLSSALKNLKTFLEESKSSQFSSVPPKTGIMDILDIKNCHVQKLQEIQSDLKMFFSSEKLV